VPSSPEDHEFRAEADEDVFRRPKALSGRQSLGETERRADHA